MIKKLFKNAKGFIILLIVTVNTILSFCPLLSFAIVKFLIPFKSFQRLMINWTMAMASNWVSCNSKIFSIFSKTKWEISGLDQLNFNSWYLLIVNHSSWVDIIVLQTIFNTRIPFLKFFIKRELVWLPILGIAWLALDMPFMKRYSKKYLEKHPQAKGKDLEVTRMACEKFRDVPTSVINFIEGTRFTEKKKLQYKSPYKFLLPPRAGGVALVLSSMGEMFDVILDVTIIYPKKTPTFWDMICGQLDHVIIDIVKRPVEDWMIDTNYIEDDQYRKRFHRWLGEIWNEKDTKISRLKD